MSCSCIFFSYLVGLNIYLQLTASGRPGVIGHHAPKHVEVELVKDPEESKHQLKMVDHNAKEYQRKLEAVMNKTVQVNILM